MVIHWCGIMPEPIANASLHEECGSGVSPLFLEEEEAGRLSHTVITPLKKINTKSLPFFVFASAVALPWLSAASAMAKHENDVMQLAT
jgi:hypothetical protein